MTIVTPKFGMGASVLRIENGSFITGRSRYIDTSQPLRSSTAMSCARPSLSQLQDRTLDDTRSAPSVRIVIIGAEVVHLGDLKSTVMQKKMESTHAPTRDIPILCRDRVNHVGDAVAFVFTDSRAFIEDAAERIEGDYDSEDALANTATALEDEAPLV